MWKHNSKFKRVVEYSMKKHHCSRFQWNNGCLLTEVVVIMLFLSMKGLGMIQQVAILGQRSCHYAVSELLTSNHQ